MTEAELAKLQAELAKLRRRVADLEGELHTTRDSLETLAVLAQRLEQPAGSAEALPPVAAPEEEFVCDGCGLAVGPETAICPACGNDVSTVAADLEPALPAAGPAAAPAALPAVWYVCDNARVAVDGPHTAAALFARLRQGRLTGDSIVHNTESGAYGKMKEFPVFAPAGRVVDGVKLPPLPVAPAAAPAAMAGPPPLPVTRPAARPASAPALAPAAAGGEKMDLETRIGVVWFNRLGLVAVAVAFALLARYIHPRLLPLHKVGIGYLLTGVLYASGWLFRAKLQRFARPVMAGALALGFFISFAAYFITPMQCFSLAGALAMMSVFTGGILLCAELWRSEETAFVALLLGHVTANSAGADATAYALTVILFLCLISLVLYLRHRWVRLTLFAALMAYGSHLAWGVQAHALVPRRELFFINLGFLSAYYFIYLAVGLVQAWRGRAGADAADWLAAAAGRAIAPLSLTLYAALTTVVYYRTALYWNDIHWFFFPLALLQIGLYLAHRRLHDAAAPLYPVLATLFVTLGFFSVWAGLTLNLVLAVEALALLVLARGLGLWFLNPLAQLVLAVNFIHFWASGAHLLGDWPAFAGAVAVALVYLVKAQLEATWRSASPGGGLAGALDKIITELMPAAALLHLLLGGGLLLYDCTEFLTLPDDATALTVAAGAALLAALVRRNWVSVVTAWLLTGLTLGLMLVQPAIIDRMYRPFPAGLWGRDQVLLGLFALAAALLLYSARRLRSWYLFLLGLGLLLLALPASFLVCGYGDPPGWWVCLAALTPLVAWCAAARSCEPLPEGREIYSSGWLGEAEQVVSKLTAAIGHGLALTAAVLTARLIMVLAVDGEQALTLLAHLTWAILFAALLANRAQLLTGLVAHFALLNGIMLYQVNAVFNRAALQLAFTPENLLVWWVVAGMLGAAQILLATAAWRRQRAHIDAGTGALAMAAVGIGGLLASGGYVFSPYWLWVAAMVAALLATELLRGSADDARWREAPGQRPDERSVRAGALVFALLTAAAVALIVGRQFAGDPTAICWQLLAWTVAVLAAAVAARSGSLAWSGVLLGVAAHWTFWLEIGPVRAAQQEPALAWSLIGLTLLAGAGYDWYRRQRVATAGPHPAAAAAAMMAQALALLLLWPFLNTYAARLGWITHPQFPAQAAAVVVLVIAGRRLRLPTLWQGGMVYALVTYGSFMLTGLTGPRAGVPDFLLPGAVMLALLLGLERVMARIPAAEEPSAAPLALLLTGAAGLLLLQVFYCAAATKGSLTTIGWVVSGLLLVGLGFWWRSTGYRRTALALLVAALVRAFVVDMARLEPLYKMIAFFGLGISLIAVSWLYTRYRDDIKRWL